MSLKRRKIVRDNYEVTATCWTTLSICSMVLLFPPTPSTSTFHPIFIFRQMELVFLPHHVIHILQTTNKRENTLFLRCVLQSDSQYNDHVYNLAPSNEVKT